MTVRSVIWPDTGVQLVTVPPPAAGEGGAPGAPEWMTISEPEGTRTEYLLAVDTARPELVRDAWWRAADRAAATAPADGAAHFWRDTVLAFLARTQPTQLEARLPALTAPLDSAAAVAAFVAAATGTVADFCRDPNSRDPAYRDMLERLNADLAECADDRPAAARLRHVLTGDDPPGLLRLRRYEWPAGRPRAELELAHPSVAARVSLLVAVNPNRWRPGCALSPLGGETPLLTTDDPHYGRLIADPHGKGRWLFTTRRPEDAPGRGEAATALDRVVYLLKRLCETLHRPTTGGAVRYRVDELRVARGADWTWADAVRFRRALERKWRDDGPAFGPLRPDDPTYTRVRVCEDAVTAAATHIAVRLDGADSPFAVVDLGCERLVAATFLARDATAIATAADVTGADVRYIRRESETVVRARYCLPPATPTGAAPTFASRQLAAWARESARRLLDAEPVAYTARGVLGASAARGLVAGQLAAHRRAAGISLANRPAAPGVPLAVPDRPDEGGGEDDPVRRTRLDALRGGFSRWGERPPPAPPDWSPPQAAVLSGLALAAGGEPLADWAARFGALVGHRPVYLLGAAAETRALFAADGALPEPAEWAAELGLLSDRDPADGGNHQWVQDAAPAAPRPLVPWPAVGRVRGATSGPRRLVEPLVEAADVHNARGVLRGAAALWSAFGCPLTASATGTWFDGGSRWGVPDADLPALTAAVAAGAVATFVHEFADTGRVAFGATRRAGTGQRDGFALCEVWALSHAPQPLRVTFAVPWPGVLVPVAVADGEAAPLGGAATELLGVNWVARFPNGGGT